MRKTVGEHGLALGIKSALTQFLRFRGKTAAWVAKAVRSIGGRRKVCRFQTQLNLGSPSRRRWAEQVYPFHFNLAFFPRLVGIPVRRHGNFDPVRYKLFHLEGGTANYGLTHENT